MSEQQDTLHAVRAMIDDRMGVSFKGQMGVHHSLIECYLLLKILDKLESIDETLTTIGDDLWDDHHNK